MTKYMIQSPYTGKENGEEVRGGEGEEKRVESNIFGVPYAGFGCQFANAK